MLLLIVILNPVISYANNTSFKSYRIFHNNALDSSFKKRLEAVTTLTSRSELYHADFKTDLCLNDGSFYPEVISFLREDAFAWGFYNKIVLQGSADFHENFLEYHGYKWNLEQLLAHEMVHCMQYNQLGFWKSKPITDIPDWKWEGYAEYIARQNKGQKNLRSNIEKYTSSNDDEWAITFKDNTIAPREYYKYWILVQYQMEIKHLSFLQLLENKVTEEETNRAMMKWFQAQ